MDKKGLKTEKAIAVTVNSCQLDLNAAPTSEVCPRRRSCSATSSIPRPVSPPRIPRTAQSSFTVKGKIDNTKGGTYELAYTAKGSKGATVTKTISVTVKQPVVWLNQNLTINAADVAIFRARPSILWSASPPTASSVSVSVVAAAASNIRGLWSSLNITFWNRPDL